MNDILFKADGFVFSYRVGAICVQNGLVLLQKPDNDPGYALPGGHVAFGEETRDTLRRELKEEIGADVDVGRLRWVAEVFFPWGNHPCHQICLYYDVSITDNHTPRSGAFTANERIEGRAFSIGFHWIPLEKLSRIDLYPENAKDLLCHPTDGVEHFIYREK